MIKKKAIKKRTKNQPSIELKLSIRNQDKSLPNIKQTTLVSNQIHPD